MIARVTPVFAKRGFRATTVDDLLSAGGVGVSNFYSLFDGKEDCFVAAFDRVVAGVRARILDELEGAEDWAEGAYIALRRVLRTVLEEPLEARLVLVEAQSAGAGPIGRYNALLDEAVALVAGARELYPAARELPASFEQTAVSGLVFYLQQCLVRPAGSSLEELLAETSDLLLLPIVGETALRRLRRAE
ncbi:MAG TPA: TetR/AcrR family transcriptional regulator [Solirubrobacterales bacterium]|nr:TetR/AcrR family transcriptional regulator [Solirubrobacterales bacterium]